MQLVRKLWSDERGEDVAEYALVMGLVAIAAIGGLTIAGGALDTWWNNLGGFIGTLNPAP